MPLFLRNIIFNKITQAFYFHTKLLYLLYAKKVKRSVHVSSYALLFKNHVSNRTQDGFTSLL